MIKNLFKFYVIFGLGMILFGCSGNGCANNNGGGSTPVNSSTTAITIDNAGVIPIFNQLTTTTLIYVHNNSNSTINNIAYTAQINTGNSSIDFVSNSSAQSCSSLKSGQSCPLMLTTPTLKSTQQQGSAMITASYSFNNKINTFNQVVSFARINSNSIQGGVFSSGANIIGYGNSMGYATVYLYGSGANQVYTINSITSNNSGVQIVNGNITGKQLASNSVQAVEVSAPTNASTSFSHYATSLIVKSTTGGRTFNSLSSIEVTPSPNGAILTSGVIPLINTAVANPAGSMFIVNSGNATATSLSVAYPVASVASTGSGECTTTLAVGAGCRIYFNLTEQKEGSGNIIVTYAGGSIASSFTQTVVWFNGIGGALLQMIANPNPIVVSATVSGTVLTTVTNIGGYNLTGI